MRERDDASSEGTVVVGTATSLEIIGPVVAKGAISRVDAAISCIDVTIAIPDDARDSVHTLVDRCIRLGVEENLVVELGIVSVLDLKGAMGWSFFDHIEELRELWRPPPTEVSSEVYRLLRKIKRRIERIYVYPLLYVLPMVAVTLALLFVLGAAPAAVTVAAAIGAAGLASTGILTQLVNRRLKELDDMLGVAKKSLPQAT